MKSRLPLASTVMTHSSYMPNESTTAVGHNGWPCFHLNPSLWAMMYYLKIWHLLKSPRVFPDITGVEWDGKQAALSQYSVGTPYLHD